LALAEVDRLEQKLAGFDAQYSEPGFFERTSPEQLVDMQNQKTLTAELLGEAISIWEALETEITELEQALCCDTSAN